MLIRFGYYRTTRSIQFFFLILFNYFRWNNGAISKWFWPLCNKWGTVVNCLIGTYDQIKQKTAEITG